MSDFSEGSDKFKSRAEAMKQAEMATIGDIYSEVPTKYSQYTLPGGENYREILIQAPVEKKIIVPDKISPVKGGGTVREVGVTETMPVFKSSHWDEPNVISHVRMNDRTYNGKKVAFMEEMQSDWAREARGKQAFDPIKVQQAQKAVDIAENNKLNYLKDLRRKYIPEDSMDALAEHSNKFTGAERNKVAELNDALEFAKTDLNTENMGIIQNPLLKDWQKVSVKRALKDAVDSDAEYFSWTTGQQQAARYNLSKQVDYISWQPFNQGKRIKIMPKQGDISPVELVVNEKGIVNPAVRFPNVPDTWYGKPIEEVIGKGIGEKITKSTGEGRLSEEGLNIGGEWAYNLYDRQVKNIVEDVTGGKVENLDLGLAVESRRNATEFYHPMQNINGATIGGGAIEAKDLKYGKIIQDNNNRNYMIVNVLPNNRFTTIIKRDLEIMNDYDLYKEAMAKGYITKDAKLKEKVWKDKAFILGVAVKYGTDHTLGSPNKTTQQSIRLTPEIKAKIRGEAPPLKQPSGNPPSFMQTPKTEKELKEALAKELGGS
jgi:hypothetical protein